MSDNEAGWQPDPTGKHDHRYWDGSQWTENVSDAGVASTDPYDAAEADPAAPLGSTEPTIVTPVGDSTDSYPTAPTPPPAAPPYVPPSPVADGGRDGDGGSKRGLVIGGAILAAVAIAVVAFLALGGDDDDPSVRAELASVIQSETDLSDSEAECVADLLVDEAGEDASRTPTSTPRTPAGVHCGVPRRRPADVRRRLRRGRVQLGRVDRQQRATVEAAAAATVAMSDLQDLEAACADGDFGACDDLYFASEIGSDLEEFGSTCGGIAEPQEGLCESTDGGEGEAADGNTDGLGDGNFRDMLTDTYQEMFSISEEKAQCLAEQVSGAIRDGELTRSR